MSFSAPTLDDVAAPPADRRAVWGRRGFLALLTAFVVLGATGLLGAHTSTTSAAAGGWDLTVRYASVARAGLDVPLVVTVHHTGGFQDDVVIRITADYLDIFETQGFTPDPTDATRDGNDLYLTFSRPPIDTFTFSYDAYVQPSSQRGRSATIAVLEDGAPVVTTHLTTHLVP